MTPENPDSTDQTSLERQRDLDWIEENRAILWMTATVAFEEIGYGFIAVDLREQTEEKGHKFGYYSEDELDQDEEELRSLLQEYDPHRQFVSVLLKGAGRSDIYLSSRPPIGWYTDMESQTQYQRIQKHSDGSA